MRVRASGEHLAGIFETCFVLLLGAILGRSWGGLGMILGRSWAVLGCSWAALGVVLGRSWFILDPLGAVFARGNEVKSILAALREQGFGAFSDPTSSQQVTWF